jgi:hypothetical protein
VQSLSLLQLDCPSLCGHQGWLLLDDMSSAPPPQNEAEKNIEIWKVKKLIKRLEAARGNGTSMISLIIREFLTPDPCSPVSINLFLTLTFHSPEGPGLSSRQNVG